MDDTRPAGRDPEGGGLALLVAASPALVVCNRLVPGLVLAGLVTVVLVISSVAMALVARHAHRRVRLVVLILVVGILVTAAERVLASWLPAVRQDLGVYLPLTGASCVLLSRAAAHHAHPGPALAVALRRSALVGLSLIGLGLLRELGGTGALVLSPGLEPVLIVRGMARASSAVVLAPAGALLIAGLLIALGRGLRRPGGE